MRQGLAERHRQSTALPAESGFLAQHGHDPEGLSQVAILAEIAGVPADRFLLKNGLIGEQEFYRALAAELGLPFVSAPRLSRHAEYPGSILAGLAPLNGSGNGFIIAPQGPSLSRLLSHRRPPGRLAGVTTPSRLARAVFQGQARTIAIRAAHDLPDHAPDLSSRDGASLAQIAGSSILALALSFGGGLAPDLALTLVAAGLSPLFLALVVLRLAASMLPNPVEPAHAPQRAGDAELPVYTVVAALYREARIASRFIAALRRIDYPSAKLDIKIVLEADDRETFDALAAIDLPAFMEVIVAPPGLPRTKPRALNVALPLARGKFTVIYDAEDVPDPGQLRLSVSAFARLPPEVACLQARLTIDNTDDTWLTRLFAVLAIKRVSRRLLQP